MEINSPNDARGGVSDAETTQNTPNGVMEGVDPTKPVGPGNPSRAHCFQPGNDIGKAGRPKGCRNAATIMKEMLDVVREVRAAGQVSETEMVRRMNEVMGENGTVKHFTQREFGLASQWLKAVNKADTAAFRVCMELAGELKGEHEPVPVTGLRPIIFKVVGVDAPPVDEDAPPSPHPAPAQ